MRSVLSCSIARERTFIDRRHKYRTHTDRVGIDGLAGLFPANGHCSRCGRYFTSTFRMVCIAGEVHLCMLPSAGTISVHLPSYYIYPYRCVCGTCSQRRTPTPGRSRQQPPQAPSLCIPKAADARHPAGGPSHRLGHLTPTSPALIIVVANVSFRPRLTDRGPEGTVGRNPTIGGT